MSIESILYQLRNLGLTVSLEGDRLAVRPPARLTPALRQAIREHKPDLERLLSETSDANHNGPPYPDGLGRVKCEHCTHREITRHHATCRVSGQRMFGIALLITCSDFNMETFH